MSTSVETEDAGGWFTTGPAETGTCFGCGPANEDGLRLRFRELEDGRTIETRVQVPAHYAGVAGVLHGGIQATVLDEVMGVAASRALPQGPEHVPCVTAEISLSYLRPVPMEGHVVARSRVERIEGRDVYVTGEIVGPDGRELTTASSRWRRLRPR